MNKKYSKRILSVALVCALLLLSGCGGAPSAAAPAPAGPSEPAPAPAPPAPQSINLIWGTASLGGTVQMVATAITTVVNKYEPNMKITVQASGGSVENPRLLRDELIDIAHTTEAVNAFRATGSFEGEQPVKLQTLVKLYGNETIFLVLEDSPIQSMEDLAGRRVCIGPTGSGVSQQATAALVTLGYDMGKDMDVINLAYNDSVDALKDGSIDVLGAFTSGQMVSPYLAQLDATAKVRALPVPPRLLEEVPLNYPDFAATYIPAGTMACLTEDSHTFASFSIEFADERLSEEVGYTIVKNIYENYDELVVYHATCAALQVENALVGVPKEIPIHPGLARYLKEKNLWDDAYTAATNP
jgi:TRAP transporter TAXI family solute receptor